MALVPCKSCKKEVDLKAKTCPHCGVKDPGVTTKAMLITIALMVVAAFLVVKACSSDDEATPAKPQLSEAECQRDLQCLAEKHFAAATTVCVPAIEKLGQYSHRWTDGTFETKFDRYRWKDQDQGVITYVGDFIEFQNGFGAFQPHIYNCEFATTSGEVINVFATPGRLD